MGLTVLGKVRLDLGRTTHRSGTVCPSRENTSGKDGGNSGVLPLLGAGREAAVSYSEVKDGARNKYIKEQERRIYFLLKVQSI